MRLLALCHVLLLLMVVPKWQYAQCYFFGGEALHYFALALTIGILFGIYSAVLVASPYRNAV